MIHIVTCNENPIPSNLMSFLRTSILMIFLTLSLIIANAQVKDKLSSKIDILKSLLSRSDTLYHNEENSETIEDTINKVNDQIEKQLTAILTDEQITKQNLYDLLEHPALGILHSVDKKLWIFNWNENTGGTYKSNISILGHKNSLGKFYVSFDERSNSNDFVKNLFPSSGAWFNTIYKLPSKSKNLYLCIGSGIGCTTCIYNTAVVVELKENIVNFDYQAFSKNEYDGNGDENLSVFTLSARLGNIEKFEFDTKTNILTYAYLTDDNTPVQSEKQKRIVRKLFFNGIKFIPFK